LLLKKSFIYICKNLSKPALLCSITSSLKRLVNTFPGSEGILTRELSLSKASLNHSNSLYLRLTVEFFNLKAGILFFEYKIYNN